MNYQKKTLNLFVQVLIATKGFSAELHLHTVTVHHSIIYAIKSQFLDVFFLPKTRKIKIKQSHMKVNILIKQGFVFLLL